MNTIAISLAGILALGLANTAVADQALAQQAGCMGCHKVDSKLIGPAFKDIAARYRDDGGAIDALVNKVKGGSQPGQPLNWGTMAMPPSPANPDDIRKVITWVMTL